MDVSVLGFSQGAILSWALAYSKSEIVRRVIALSGYIHESIDTSDPPKFIGYASHGISDEIIPIKMARDSVFPISQKHNEIEYHEFSDGHNVSQENFKKILIWLERTKL
jgi:phospholipase/carboxylesterase